MPYFSAERKAALLKTASLAEPLGWEVYEEESGEKTAELLQRSVIG
ncbi:hypothetical protein PSH58_01685 [Pseudomonas hefeiensis]|uniref:Uncharacterized protein n=1 Tax=Pseudomonas hefeiensis TaxID=2738125 RepID=A0ABY9GBP7_9PSED|nr:MULTISPECIES: hypothetical protein [unclassified Pseudomonas]WLH13100.1 hypothetical protein PSH57_01685 [Pseudomonas sp. FP205]WLH96167.1 hypothetical protein PSH58_01685 [Pseudomonas sp. FP53]WLI40437.1 hypothetical protein PSH74_01685 [Pseudomonas sp. FP821]